MTCKGGIIEKTVSKRYKAIIYQKVWKIEQGDFLKTRKKNGLSTTQFETCFCCGHRFTNNEIPNIALIIGAGNRFLCDECVWKEDTSNEHGAEGTPLPHTVEKRP